MVKIAYVLPHVPTPERVTIAVYLRRQLRGLRVYPDPTRRGVWTTVREALVDTYRRESKATHVCILNDDLGLCRRFDEHLTAAVAARPDHLVQPFTMSRKQREAHGRGDSWMTSVDLVAGGATFPLAWVGPMVRAIDASWDAAYNSDDTRVAWWVTSTGKGPIWHTVPSLVEHLLAGDSTMGHSNRSRVARVFDPDPSPDFATIPDKPVAYTATARTRGIERYLR